MAAQRTEKEDAEFNLIPERTEAPRSLSPTASSPAASLRFSRSAASPARPPIQTSQESDDVSPPPEAPAVEKKDMNRCAGCRRKVGLTGFRCRCGDLFCSEHRYSDRHVCSFDYKTAGREAIARENPLVKAAKIIRI